MSRVYVPTTPLIDQDDPINKGLTCAWGLSEGGGSKATDWSGRQNTGSFTNFASSMWVPAPLGRALSFSGSQMVSATIGKMNSLVASSVSFWMKGAAGASATFGRIIEKGANQDWGICVNGGSQDNCIMVQVGDGTQRGSYVNVVLDNKWHHVVATISIGGASTTINVYLDGVDRGPAVLSGPGWVASTGTNPINLAQYSGSLGANNFVGTLQNVRFFSRVLTYFEVRRLYVEPMAGLLSPRRPRLQFKAAAANPPFNRWPQMAPIMAQ